MGLKPRSLSERNREPAFACLTRTFGGTEHGLHGHDVIPCTDQQDPLAYLELLAKEIGVLEARLAVMSDTDWEQMRPDDYAEYSWDLWKRHVSKVVAAAVRRVPTGTREQLFDRARDLYNAAFDEVFESRLATPP